MPLLVNVLTVHAHKLAAVRREVPAGRGRRGVGTGPGRSGPSFAASQA